MKRKKLMIMGIVIVMSSMVVAFRGNTSETVKTAGNVKMQYADTDAEEKNTKETNQSVTDSTDAAEDMTGTEHTESEPTDEISAASYGRSMLGEALDETGNEMEMQTLPSEDEKNSKLAKYGTEQTIEASKYGIEKENIPVIATVNNYVNVRSFPSEESEVVGKLYDKSVGTLLKNDADWMYIQSGSVTGYVKAEYVLIGEEAEKLANEVGVRMAKVTTTTLKVRTEPTTDSAVLGLVPEGDLLLVTEEKDGFAKISIEEGEGYVSTEYVSLKTENVVAESKEEEEQRLEKERQEREAAEAAARKALEEQRKKEEAAKAEAARKAAQTEKKAAAAQAASAASKPSSTTNKTESSKPQTTASSGSSSTSNAALGQQIVNYAVQFIGNPYVYGGNSLTNGIDCSGFVMKVYQKFGINLPRTSGEQGASGSKVDGLGNAKPGDLIWYSGHIGIYMGNGQIVHASNAREGIKISQATYRTILGIRRII